MQGKGDPNSGNPVIRYKILIFKRFLFFRTVLEKQNTFKLGKITLSFSLLFCMSLSFVIIYISIQILNNIFNNVKFFYILDNIF